MVYSYQWWWIRDAVCHLLPHVASFGVTRKVLLEANIGVALIYLLGGFLSGIFITCIFIRGVKPLLARLDPAYDEVDGYTNSIKIVTHLTQNL